MAMPTRLERQKFLAEMEKNKPKKTMDMLKNLVWTEFHKIKKGAAV